MFCVLRFMFAPQSQCGTPCSWSYAWWPSTVPVWHSLLLELCMVALHSVSMALPAPGVMHGGPPQSQCGTPCSWSYSWWPSTVPVWHSLLLELCMVALHSPSVALPAPGVMHGGPPQSQCGTPCSWSYAWWPSTVPVWHSLLLELCMVALHSPSVALPAPVVICGGPPLQPGHCHFG